MNEVKRAPVRRGARRVSHVSGGPVAARWPSFLFSPAFKTRHKVYSNASKTRVTLFAFSCCFTFLCFRTCMLRCGRARKRPLPLQSYLAPAAPPPVLADTGRNPCTGGAPSPVRSQI